MKDIKTLIEICRRKGQRSIQLVNQNFRKKEISKDNQLYQGIIEELYTTDRDASSAIFKTDPNSRNYRNAKSKLRHKLLNHLYFLDYEKDTYSLKQKVAYDLEHQLHQTKILITENAGEIAKTQLQSIAKTALQYEFSEIRVTSLLLLLRLQAKDGKLSHYYDTVSQLKHAQAFNQTVHKAEQLYYEVMAKSNKSLSSQTKVIKEIPGVVRQIQQLAQTYQSRRLDVLARKLQLLYLQLTNDFEGVVLLINKIDEQYLSVPQNQVIVDFDRKEVSYLKLGANYYLSRLVEGKAYAQKAIPWFHPGDKDWFQFLELYFLLLMKGEASKEAANLYRMVRTNKNFVSLCDSEKQRWQIYRAYLLFTYDHKLLRWGFDLDEFLNSPPSKITDNPNLAINIIVIQIMFLLKQGSSSKVKQYVQLLTPYNSPHLDKRRNYRNSIFIRLLHILVKEEFNYEIAEQRGVNYLAKLSETKFSADIKGDLEVISYEVLWKNILDMLKTKNVYLHYRFYQN